MRHRHALGALALAALVPGALTLGALLLLAAPARAQATLQVLRRPASWPVTGTTYSIAGHGLQGLSQDGETVVAGGTIAQYQDGGETPPWHTRLYTWRAGVRRSLPNLDETFNSDALAHWLVKAVANDGAVLAYERDAERTSCDGEPCDRIVMRAYRLRGDAKTAAPTGDPFRATFPSDLSPDGRVAVGTTYRVLDEYTTSPPRGFVWTRAGAFSVLPARAGFTEAEAAFVSDDGRVVAGYVYNEGSADGQAVVWRDGGAPQPIPRLPGAGSCGASALSGDGRVVYGYCDGAAAFRWTAAEGTTVAEGLPLPWNGPQMQTTTDGERVHVRGGLVWDRGAGVSLVADLARAQGVDLAEHERHDVWYMADDGRTFAGYVQEGTGLDAEYPPFRLQLETDVAIVNRTDDADDVSLGDDHCDVDAGLAGDQCTLRAAIDEANEGTFRRIRFSIRDADDEPLAGVPTIYVKRALPPVQTVRPLRLDGTTQPAGRVHLQGTGADGSEGLNAEGLVIEADSATVRGLVLTGFRGHGVWVQAGRGVVIERTVVGYDPEFNARPSNDDVPNYGVYVSDLKGPVGGVTIGSADDADMNRLLGGVVIGGTARGVRVLKNVLEVEPATLDSASVDPWLPLDLASDLGPNCAPWTPVAGGRVHPNDNLAAPRITNLTAATVDGLTVPGAVVIAYRAEAPGRGEWRYWARRVVPAGLDTADAEGRFSVAVDLAPGTRVAVTATDAHGNTSELSQLRRPVIYVPGISGSWLKAPAPESIALWLPLGATDDEKNDRLARLAMWPDGTSREPLVVDGIVELGGHEVYGPILGALQAAGYAGDPANVNRATNDLWRFANDWRRSTEHLADDLKAFVDDVTAGPGVARSCEVDLAAHSNGGLVASVYVKKHEAHAADHVHRLLTAGTPYLGAAQAYATQTRGYAFGIDEVPPFSFGWDVAWGRILDATRNIPGGYGLLPSRAYWDAWRAPEGSAFMLPDLDGAPLKGYDATRAFLTGPKLDGGIARGLDRNAALLDAQQSRVHGLVDDWRTYARPPQIFRHVGVLPASTTVAWWTPPSTPETLGEGETARSEPGDTDRHRAYREGLAPALGLGDGTVPLVSATLGRHALVGRLDLSGVDESPWIEGFEYYGCLHVDLLGADCRRADDVSIHARTVEILRSGYEVVAPSGAAVAASRVAGSEATAADGREVLVVVASAPVAVHVTDAQGRHTGPTGAGRALERGVPGLLYEASARGATVSLPAGAAYTLSVTPRGAAARVRVVRQIAGADDARQTALFPEQALAAGGVLRFALDGGAPTLSAPLAVDAAGTGSAAPVAPAATTTGPGGTAAFPGPDRLAVEAEHAAPADTLTRATVELSGAGAGWTWSLDEPAPWIVPDTASGAAPGALAFALRSAGLPDGAYADTLRLAFRQGAYEVAYPLVVRLTVARGELPVELTAFEARADGAAVVLAWTTASETNNAGFAVETRAADAGAAWRELARVPGHGTTAEAHAYGFRAEGLAPGRHAFRLRQVDLDGAARHSAHVEAVVVPAAALALSAPAPSPARGAARLTLAVREGQAVRAALYDALGREVALLYDGPVTPDAPRALVVDGGALASGLYVVRAVGARGVAVRPLTLVR